MMVSVRNDAFSSEQASPGPLGLATCATMSLPMAAQILGIHRSTAWDLHKRGEFPIPVLRIGSRLRVTKASLEAFLQTGDHRAAPLGNS